MTTTALSDRSLGWLRYLSRKANTPDEVRTTVGAHQLVVRR